MVSSTPSHYATALTQYKSETVFCANQREPINIFLKFLLVNEVLEVKTDFNWPLNRVCRLTKVTPFSTGTKSFTRIAHTADLKPCPSPPSTIKIMQQLQHIPLEHKTSIKPTSRRINAVILTHRLRKLRCSFGAMLPKYYDNKVNLQEEEQRWQQQNRCLRRIVPEQ